MVFLRDMLPTMQATPWSVTGFSAPCCSDGVSDPVQSPPASDRSSSTPTKTRVKVAFVRTGLEEGGNEAWPPWQRHHPSYRLCSSVTVVVFIIFGYKVIQLKGRDWNKAMWEERGVYSAWWVGLHDAAFSWSMAAGRNGRGENQDQTLKTMWQLLDILSCVGRGFFSWVSVFFSLDLSKLATSEMSGLSLIVAALQGNRQAWILGVLAYITMYSMNTFWTSLQLIN